MIAEAARSIEQLTEAIRQELDRKYAYYRMLHATDRVLNQLEELNLRGVTTLPWGAVPAIRRTLRELPSSCIAMLADSDRVQVVLDAVFAIQEQLFVRFVPGWRELNGEGEGG